jgi:hypothetical protein
MTQICNNQLHGFMERGLFTDAVSLTEVILCIVERYERMVAFGELARIGKEVIIYYVTIYSRFLFLGTEKKRHY